MTISLAVPDEVARPDGCDCPRPSPRLHLLDCAIYELPADQRLAAARVAEDRVREWCDAHIRWGWP